MFSMTDIKAFTDRRAARKKLRAAAGHASTIYKMQRDTVPPEKASELLAAIEAARRASASASSSTAELDAALAELDAALAAPWRPLHPHSVAENFEVIVVALAVAMAFRCYFLQPFKIPTGSMQPTLYGIHVEERREPGFWDRAPFKAAKWIVTGDWYKEVRVKAGGAIFPIQQTLKPGYVSFKIAGQIYHVPTEAVVSNGMIDWRRLRGIRPDGTVPAGTVIWSGLLKAGDHVFVNRVAWNFRRPRRGDVMVFSTTGIDGCPQGTHYIKRMCGLPGESVSIYPPNLLINGHLVEEPKSILRVARRERLRDGLPPYAGYLLITTNSYITAEAPTPLCTVDDVVHLGQHEYYALGDNTANSRDGRYWGPVPEGNLLGPALFVYWPFTHVRLID